MPAGIQLQFLSNESEEDEGLGHAGIETYRSKPYAGAAREIGQNSRDAAATLPVRVAFDLLEVPQTEIPGIEHMRQTVECCLREANRDNREKEKAFFQHAKGVLYAPSLKVLRIADYNTTGARGPAATKGTPFYSLTRANGVSAKDREDSGGSYGIGKNAAFAVSDLRTVFYSTVYEEGNPPSTKFLSIGKSVLVSHHDAVGRPFRQIGYWGLPDFRAVEDPSLLPGWLQRAQPGTSVFVVAFRQEPDWQNRIASALIMNFFPAVHLGQMEFTIDGGRTAIGRETLTPLFNSPEIESAAEASGHKEEFEIARHHYECLISPEAKDHEVNIPRLGRVSIKVLVREGLPKKICITRNGLVITDSLKNFGMPFSRFPMHRDFVAVVTPLDTEGSAFIKKLEDPRHEELSPEGLPDEQSRDEARRVIKKLGEAIRSAIKAEGQVQYEREVAAEEMRKYFAGGAEPQAKNRNSPNDDPETLRYKVEPKRPRQPPNAVSPGPDEEADDHVLPHQGPGPHSGPGPQPGPGPGPGPVPAPGPVPDGPKAPRPLRSVRLDDVRNIIPKGMSPASRALFFTAQANGKLIISVVAIGVAEGEVIPILRAAEADVASGVATVSVQAGRRQRLDIDLAEPYDGPIEIRASLIDVEADQ